MAEKRKPVFIVEVPEYAHVNQEMRVSSITGVFMKGIPEEEYHVVVIPTKNLEWRFSQFDGNIIDDKTLDDFKRQVDVLIQRFEK